jgi:large subunit ribosomal protein L27
MGKDHTLFALADGKVEFRKRRNDKSYVSIVVEEKETEK